MTHQQCKNRVLKLLPKLQRRLKLDHWHIYLYFTDKENGFYATIEPNNIYLRANVEVCLPYCAKLNDEELESILIHELSHLLVADMVALIENVYIQNLKEEDQPHARSILNLMEERVVVQVTRAITGRMEFS